MDLSVYYQLLVKIDSIVLLSLEKKKHTSPSQSQRESDKERACPHPATDINNTSDPSLIS